MSRTKSRVLLSLTWLIEITATFNRGLTTEKSLQRRKVLKTLNKMVTHITCTSTPAYLQALLVPHIPSRPLRSSHAPRLAVPRTRTVFASCAFSFAAPTICNSLPENVVNSYTLATVKKRQKTHLYHCVMLNVLAIERLCISYYGAIQVLSLYCSCAVRGSTPRYERTIHKSTPLPNYQ